MNSEQRQQIRGLIKKYSDSGTESLIAFVAETDGMLAACQALLHSLDAVDSTSTEWLQRECSGEKVTFHAFLQEISKIVALFQRSRNVEDHYATLGVSTDAGLDEIKQAYRTLSLRYHPDTASPKFRNNPEKFIAINKAYQALLAAGSGGNRGNRGDFVEKPDPEKQWRPKRERRIPLKQRKSMFIWTVGFLLLLVVVTAVASIHIKRQAMLAGLKESRGAFIPPVKKIAADSADNEAMVEHQPINRRSLQFETAKTPGRELVAKIQAEPEVGPVNVQPKELPQQGTGNVIVTPLSPNNTDNEKNIAELSVAVGPNRDLEKTEAAAVTVHAAVPEPITARVSAKAVEKQIPVQYPEVKGNIEKTGSKSIGGVSVSKNAPGAMPAKPDKTDHPATLIRRQAVRNEQPESGEPVVVFNTKVPGPAANISDAGPVREAQLTQAAIGEVVPLPADVLPADNRKQKNKDMQKRVDRFLTEYIKAYEQRNLILFSRFFEGEAEENGEPFTAILPTYLDLFATTRHISLQVDQRNWSLVNGKVAVDGQFKVQLEYADGRTIYGSGPIYFVLADKGGELLVTRMEYVFHSEE